MAETVQINLGANVAGAIQGLASFARSAQLAAAAFTTGFAVATKQAIDFADQIGKAAQKAGQSVEEFSKLAYVGQQAGIDIGGLQAAFKALSTSMQESGRVFNEIGVRRFGEAGEWRRTSDVLDDIADIFEKMPDGARKTSLAVQLFGKSGLDLIPVLNQGREGLRAQRKEAEELGLVIGSRFAKQADDFNSNITKIQSGFKGMALDIAKEVLPSLVSLTNEVVRFIKESRASASWTDGFLGGVKDATDKMLIGAKAWVAYLRGGKSAVDEMMANDLVARLKQRISPADEKESEPKRDEVELLAKEADLRLRIQQTEVISADGSKRWDLSRDQRDNKELLHLQQKLSLYKKLAEEIEPDVFKPNFQLQSDPGKPISKEEAEIMKDLLPVLREYQQIQERINELQEGQGFSGKLAQNLGAAIGHFTDFSSRAAETITSGVMVAVDGLADSITGLIQGTRNWADVWRSVTSNILGMIVQLIVRFLVLSALMATLSFLFPGSGFVGKLATFTGVAGGRASGGLVTSGLYQVGEQGPEYVVDSPTLRRLGSGFFDSLRSGATPPAAGSSGGSSKVHIGFINGPGQMADWMQSTDGRKVIVDIMSQEIHHFRG